MVLIFSTDTHALTISADLQVIQSYYSSLVPRPEEEEKGPGFSCLCMCLINHGGIPLPPHTVDILPYACDDRIDTERNTVRTFMIAKYGMQGTHSIVILQFEAINRQCELSWSRLSTRRGYLPAKPSRG